MHFVSKQNEFLTCQNRYKRTDISFAFSFSYPSGQPPTPTKTPTSASFAQSSFQTPRAESSFYDFWSTPDPNVRTPNLLKTPRNFTLITPTKCPPISSAQKRPLSGQNLETEIASHVHHLSPNPNLALPPVEPSRQLSSSPNPSSTSSAKRRCPTASDRDLDLDTDLAMRSASSMQTPPPTSTSASRRKAQQAQVAKLVQQSAASGRRMSSPAFANPNHVEITNARAEESPQQFPSLQFSPDVFGFPMSGPATAPTYPQHKLFWDPNQATDEMSIDFPNEDTYSFGTGAQKAQDPFLSFEENSSLPQLPITSLFNGFNTNGGDTPLTSSTSILAPNQASSLPPSRSNTKGFSRAKHTTNAVNPSLLFSSPGRLFDSSIAASSSQNLDEDTLQPYAHQIRDARIERDLKLNHKLKKIRGPETDSPAVKAALQTLREDGEDRPRTQRSVTESIMTQNSDDPNRKGNAVSTRAGKARLKKGGPDKKSQLQNSLNLEDSICCSQKRTAVTLTIDACGRAKTETRTVVDRAEVSNYEMDVDSESGDSASDMSVNREKSSIGDCRPQPVTLLVPKMKQPKLGRFTTESKSHSQRSSYASTFDSSCTSNSIPGSEHAKALRLSRLSLDTRAPERRQAIAFDKAAVSTESELDSGTEALMGTNDGRGDAQSELKKILNHRGQGKAVAHPARSEPKSTHSAQRHAFHPQHTQSHSYGFNGDTTPDHGRLHDAFPNTSPTTITDPDLTTPSTDRESQISDSTRCVCHVPDSDGQYMILWYVPHHSRGNNDS